MNKTSRLLLGITLFLIACLVSHTALAGSLGFSVTDANVSETKPVDFSFSGANGSPVATLHFSFPAGFALTNGNGNGDLNFSDGVTQYTYSEIGPDTYFYLSPPTFSEGWFPGYDFSLQVPSIPGVYHFTVEALDGGNGVIDSDTGTINVHGIFATNISQAETYTEDVPHSLSQIVATDPDSAVVTARLTLSDPSAGSINTGTSGAVTSTFSGGVWTASGAIGNVNTLLSNLVFTPASNYNSNFTIATNISDGTNAAFVGSKAITGIPVNDAPTATNLSAAETYTQDTALNLTDIVASDIDSTNVTATLTLSNATAGQLSTDTSGTVASTYDSGTGVWTATGAIADVNILLSNLTFTPASGYNSNFTITTSISDGIAAAIAGSKAMTGIAISHATPAPVSSSAVSSGGGCAPGSPCEAQVSLIQTRLAAVTAPSASSTLPKMAAFQFEHNLNVGMSDSDTQKLQKFLNGHGFPIAATGPGSPGSETIYFGMHTKQALASFQKNNNIFPSLGFFGPITRGEVNGMLGQ